MLRAIIIFLFGAITTNLFAQHIPDGYREGRDSEGRLTYKGTFKAGKPVGEFLRFYPNGSIRAKMYYQADNVKTTFFNQNGDTIATGSYKNKLREGEWLYYSSNQSTPYLSLRSQYSNGNLDGLTESYYPSGKVAERILYKAGSKEGKWFQYYESGQIKLSALYKKNLLEGEMLIYYPDGTIEHKSKYLHDIPDGNWYQYDADGKVLLVRKYKKGELLNKDEIEARETELLQQVEDSKTLMKEPMAEDFLREAGQL